MTTILITRPEHQAEPFRSDLEALGAEVLHQPTIEIRPPDSWIAVDDAIRRLIDSNRPDAGFDWLVFSSSNGVASFFDRARTLREQDEPHDPEATTFGIADDGGAFFNPFRIAVVGTGTDDALQKRTGRRADVLPDLFAAEGILEHLLPEAKRSKRFLLLRASRGRDILKRTLEQAGGNVTEVVVYQSVDVRTPMPEILDRMCRGSIDWTTATSSSIARSLVRLFGDALKKTRLVSISPITSATLEELGYRPTLEAKTASLPGIVEVLKPVIDGAPR